MGKDFLVSRVAGAAGAPETTEKGIEWTLVLRTELVVGVVIDVLVCRIVQRNQDVEEHDLYWYVSARSIEEPGQQETYHDNKSEAVVQDESKWMLELLEAIKVGALH